MKSYGDALSRYGAQLLLLAVVAALTCANQLFQKAGVSRGGPIAVSLDGLLAIRAVPRSTKEAGYALGAVTNLIWLTALSRFEVSFAAPVMASLYFVFLLAASSLVLGEAVSSNRWVGTLLIVAGMLLVGRK